MIKHGVVVVPSRIRQQNMSAIYPVCMLYFGLRFGMRFVLIFATCTFMAGVAGAQNSANEIVKAMGSERARTSLSSTELESKLLTLNQAIAESPQNPDLLLRKGVYLQELGRTSQAIDVFENLRLAYPTHPAPYINLASAYAQQGNLEEARQMLVKSDSLYAGRYQTHLSLASINIGLALASIRKANELNPGDLATERKIKDIEALLSKLNGQPGFTAVPLAGSGSGADGLKKVVPVSSRSQRGKLNQSVEASVPQSKGDRLKLSALELTEVPTSVASTDKATPLRAKSSEPINDETRAEILNTVESWASAWSRRSYADYLSYYSNQFHVPNGASRESWAKIRQSAIEKTSSINVDVKVQKIKITDNKAYVLITQRYSSDIYSDAVRKELKLIFENGSWKIQSEKSL